MITFHTSFRGFEMTKEMPSTSIVVATYNRSEILEKSLNAMLEQDFPSEYEIIVVNDCSTDDTAEVLEKFSGMKKVNLEENRGPAAVRNIGIKMAEFPIVVIMDDDCVPERDWLKGLVSGFSEGVGITSSFSIHGGTSTAYLKKAVEEAGYFDEAFPFEYREDTDLVFKIMDMGYRVKTVDAKFKHVHRLPDSLFSKARYVYRRLWVHQVDPLLYKKHPARTSEFLDIRFGFLRDPAKDFQVATGTWTEGAKFSLSSPQGVVLIENKTPLHALIIILGGLAYVLAVKLARLYGSIKYKKLLI